MVRVGKEQDATIVGKIKFSTILAVDAEQSTPKKEISMGFFDVIGNKVKEMHLLREQYEEKSDEELIRIVKRYGMSSLSTEKVVALGVLKARGYSGQDILKSGE